MKEPAVVRKAIWEALYLGAFYALEVNHKKIVNELVALTTADEDVFDAIVAMRTADKGNRVHAARECLRMKKRRL